MAATCGVDPRPWSLRELCWMTAARVEADWNHTAALLAMAYNAAPSHKRKPTRTALDFHPFARRSERRPRLTRQQTTDWLDRAVGA